MDVRSPFAHNLSSSSFAEAHLRVGEVTSAIVCGCLPLMPQLFRHHVPKIRKTLSAALRNKRKRRSEGPQRPEGARDDILNQALVKGSYVELDEHSQSGTRSETEITTHKGLDEMEDEMNTQRIMTIV